MEALKGSAKKVSLKDILEKTVVVKLNGGLGTSMGLEKAKSLLIVKDGKTFLDLIVEQVRYMRKVYDAKINFTLMNSFSTSEDTMAYLKTAYPDIVTEVDLELMQNQVGLVYRYEKIDVPEGFPHRNHIYLRVGDYNRAQKWTRRLLTQCHGRPILKRNGAHLGMATCIHPYSDQECWIVF